MRSLKPPVGGGEVAHGGGLFNLSHQFLLWLEVFVLLCQRGGERRVAAVRRLCLGV